MSTFVETQCFMQFVIDRHQKSINEFDILFFDESIKEKMNRSKLKLNKDTTPFLKVIVNLF
jgi:hypothetical protein